MFADWRQWLQCWRLPALTLLVIHFLFLQTAAATAMTRQRTTVFLKVLPSFLLSLSLRVSHEDILVKMVGKEQNDRHRKSFMQKHPSLQPRMRSIVLDWLIEVSEAYTLQWQTLYLAQDYFDRFMLTQNNVEKDELQLIGTTCLFIASKMEEACPPKLSQMAYVTAGTYYEKRFFKWRESF
ncbi:hypothetical protein JOB18_016295 [Solea senegalensis]|uniref:G2/mitotic-specific cyclin-B2 n=1 Tax=Solea senegalensis TaxID=28829 RepID=A0AAV6R6Q0_SOLSE|nr:hypothetical protein JOB18_016295 [Solea senegalensis]